MKLISVLLIAFALGATPALADKPKYELKYIPKCSLQTLVDGKTVCAYTLAEWKLVLGVDAAFKKTSNDLKKEKERTDLLSQQVTSLLAQVSLYLNSQKSLVSRNDQLTNELISLDMKYQKERVKPRWGSPLAWTIAAVSASVLSGFVIHSILN